MLHSLPLLHISFLSLQHSSLFTPSSSPIPRPSSPPPLPPASQGGAELAWQTHWTKGVLRPAQLQHNDNFLSNASLPQPQSLHCFRGSQPQSLKASNASLLQRLPASKASNASLLLRLTDSKPQIASLLHRLTASNPQTLHCFRDSQPQSLKSFTPSKG